MANIKKTFNFRNGVQVDEDNLIVNARGLVGIGTTIPTEALDVRGTAKVVGLVTSQEGFVGVFTAHTSSLGTVALSTSIIGAGVSIKSGIITSNSATGLVTYYGDARFLQGMPTSQWEDTNAGFGVSSIFNTGGTVGIATTNPQFTLQVGDNVNNGENGVGISSAGHIKASGIITATTFSGNFNGSVDSSALNATGVSTLGVSTFTGAVSFGSNALFGDNDKILLGNNGSEFQVYHDGSTSIIKSGEGNLNLQTATGEVVLSNTAGEVGLSYKHNDRVEIRHDNTLRFSTSGVGVTVYNQLDTTNMVVSGVSTFQDDINFIGAAHNAQWDQSNNRLNFAGNAHAIFGFGTSNVLELRGNWNTGSSILNSSGTLYLDSVNDVRLRTGTVKDALRAYAGGSVELYYGSTPTKVLATSGIGVTVYNQLDTTNIVASGVITATTELNSPLVGVGTDDPATDIQVRKSGAAQIRVTSDTNAAIVSIGRESSSGNGNNAALRYGNNSAGFPYSNPDALDIINYDNGNINFYLSAATQGGFYWHKGPNNARLMTLTKDGSLGIGVTLPTERLHVGGGITCTSPAWFGSSVNVTGNLGVTGDINLTGNLNVPAGLSGELWEGNVLTKYNGNTALGIVTTQYLNVTGVTTITTSLAIANNSNIGDNKFVAGSGDNKVWISATGCVGISTTIINDGIELEVGGDGLFAQSVGVGTTNPRCALDFADVVSVNGTNRDKIAYMLPPRLKTSERDVLTNVAGTGVEPGAIIYNTDDNKHQGYDGSNWNNLY